MKRKENSQKDKKCKACGTNFKPFSSLNKYCSFNCAKSDTKVTVLKHKKPIRAVSTKRAKENKIYSQKRKEFLSLPENQVCPITGLPATDVHHKYSGKDRAKYYLDTSTWLAVSREGHNWIHSNPKEARNKGFLM